MGLAVGRLEADNTVHGKERERKFGKRNEHPIGYNGGYSVQFFPNHTCQSTETRVFRNLDNASVNLENSIELICICINNENLYKC